MLHLTAIVAMTSERVIGKNGKLPWHLPADLAFFKQTTLGHPVIMGRKTYDSIGKPLPKRRNIVMTRDPDWHAEGVEVIHGPDDLADLTGLEGRVFVIGGANVYNAFLPLMDEWLVSHIFQTYEGDTWLADFEKIFPMSEVVLKNEEFEVRRWTRE